MNDRKYRKYTKELKFEALWLAENSGHSSRSGLTRCQQCDAQACYENIPHT